MKRGAFEENRLARQRTPLFISFCTIVSVVVFVIQLELSGWDIFGDMTTEGAALDTERVKMYNEWYRLLTSTFMHAGIVHLLLCLTFLWIIGYYIERRHGSTSIAMIFMFSALGGAVASCTQVGNHYDESKGVVGLSGGVCSLAAMTVVDYFTNADAISHDHMMMRASFRERSILFLFFIGAFDWIILVSALAYSETFCLVGCWRSTDASLIIVSRQKGRNVSRFLASSASKQLMVIGARGCHEVRQKRDGGRTRARRIWGGPF